MTTTMSPTTMTAAALAGRPTAELLEHFSAIARGASGHAAAAAALEVAAEVSPGARRRLLALAAADAQLAGQPDRAAELWRRAAETGEPLPEVLINQTLAAARTAMTAGRHRAAERQLAAVVASLWDAGAVHRLPEALAARAVALVQAGDLADGLAEAAQASALATLTGDRTSRCRALRARSLAAVVRGEAGQIAGADVDDVEASVPDLIESRLLAERGLTGAELTVLTGLTSTGTPPAAANAWRVLGLAAATTEAAVVCFAWAARLHSAMDLPFEAARLRLAHGERLRRDGGRVEAREHLRAAGDGFRRLGAMTWAARADREIAATDEARRPTGTRGATRTQGGLTAQEFAVAEVVATGVSTRDAAAQLFLSPKTIEFHLGNVFRKLGVTNRAHLAHVFPAVVEDDHAA